jgi:hypothetical protein
VYNIWDLEKCVKILIPKHAGESILSCGAIPFGLKCVVLSRKHKSRFCKLNFVFIFIWHRRYSDSLRAWPPGDRMPVKERISAPVRCGRVPWDPPSRLYNGYRVSFPGAKRLGHGVKFPLPSSAEIKDRVEPYLYSLSGSSWPVPGRNLLLLFSYKLVYICVL